MLAILNIGGPEMVVLLIVGLLLFGRRLPEVGRSLGKTLAQLRRGLQDFKDQIDRDEDIRDIKTTVRELQREVRTPHRVMTDPGGMLRDLTDEALATPGPSPSKAEVGKPAGADAGGDGERSAPPEGDAT